MNWESEPAGAETELTSPHFDDETTLVTAKKVVPLDEVASKARVKSRLVQGFSLAVVGVLGILVVVGLYSYFGSEESDSQRDLSAQASSQSLSQKADGGTLQSAVAEDSEANATGSIPQKVSKPAVHTSEKVKVKSKSEVTTQPPVSVSFDAQPEPDDWQTRREMRREARRLERQSMRERRRRDVGDGIFRINDIFEGRNRP